MRLKTKEKKKQKEAMRLTYTMAGQVNSCERHLKNWRMMSLRFLGSRMWGKVEPRLRLEDL